MRLTNMQILRMALVYIGPTLITRVMFGVGPWVGLVSVLWIVFLIVSPWWPQWITNFINHGKLRSK